MNSARSAITICHTCGQQGVSHQEANDPARLDDLFSSLDPETATALQTGEINEQMALRLASEPNIDRRVQILNRARQLAGKRITDLS